MKSNKISLHLFVFFSLVFFYGYSQNEFIPPSLDTGKKIHNLKFSPDQKNEKILSAYLKGVTERDTIKIKAKIDVMLQHIMVAVVTEKNANPIYVEIVKKNWNDIKRKASTKNGVYQETFDTAGKFGIKIYSNKPGIKFNVIVWRSPEIIPKTDHLFYPASEFKDKYASNYNGNNSQEESSNNEASNSSKDSKSSLFKYLLIALLGIIVALLLFMVKNKKSQKASIIIFILLSSQMSFAGIVPSNPFEMMNTAKKLMDAKKFMDEYNKQRENGGSSSDFLDQSDSDYMAKLDDSAGPKLPSSCYKMQSSNHKENSSDRNHRENQNNNQQNTDNSDFSNDSDNPKYDKDGNPIENNSNTQQNNPNPENPFVDDYQTVSEGDGLKKDKDGNPIPPEKKDSETIRFFDSDHPKYDKDGKPIQYDTSNRPKYDEDGVPIQYGTENDQTDYNRLGRPKYDKDGRPIKYDDVSRPKYDKNGMAIHYKDEPYQEEGAPEKIENTGEKNDFNAKGRVKEDHVSFDDKSNGNQKQSQNESPENRNNNESNNRVGRKNPSQDNVNKKDACDCLKEAYEELKTVRVKFEKLKMIYNHTKKIYDWSVSFGDDVSSATGGMSGLAWQKEKTKIIKNMDVFYKAYDKKHLEFADRLENSLKKIDECEAKLGFENWYSRVGFIYYTFLKDKYKRQ